MIQIFICQFFFFNRSALKYRGCAVCILYHRERDELQKTQVMTHISWHGGAMRRIDRLLLSYIADRVLHK